MTRPTAALTWLVGLSMLLSTMLAACGGAHARYSSHLERGRHYLVSGNLEKASVEFRNALQIEPKNAEALFLNARLAEQRRNVREAVGLYQAALDANSDYVPARGGLGKVFVFAGAAQRALDVVAPGLTRHPDDPDLLAVRAAARHQLKNDTEARADAERAVRLAPGNENAVAILAALYSSAGDSPQAIRLVSAAVAQAPSSIELREVLTNLYLASAQPDKAEEQMRKIIDLRPREISLRAQLAMHYVRTHQLDAAQRVLERTVKDFSASVEPSIVDEARLMLVDFISTQRSREQGEKTLRGFIAQDPDNLDLRLGLGALLQRVGAAAEAITVYQEVINRDGTHARGLTARDRVAAILASQGRSDQALVLVSQVLQKNPRDDAALILRANMKLLQYDPADAIVDLRAVLRDQPNSVPLRRTLARAYIEKGELALAQEELRAAVDAAPGNVATRIELAQLLRQGGHVDQATAFLEETVRRLPQDVQVREVLARTYLAQRNFAAAAAAAEDLKRLQPNSAVGFYLAGVAALEERHLDDSRTELERALELQPAGIDSLAARARVEIVRGAPAAAIARVQYAADRDPNNPQILNLLGELYLNNNDLANAARTFTQAVSVNSRWWVSHRNLALAKAGSNDVNGALEEYAAALKLAPLEPKLVLEAAGFDEKHDRVDAAIMSYELLYKGNRGVQQLAANNLAMLLVTYKSDRANLDKARALTSGFASSENGSLLDTSGWVLFKRGEYKEALPVLERAAAHAPDSKVIHYHLGMAELQLGLRDRARNHLESALAGSGEFSGSEEARSILASLHARSG